MKLWQGLSLVPDARIAVAEAVLGWDVAAAPPDLLIAFTSTKQDPSQVAECLAERFPHTLVVGCTTAGEMLGDAHHNGSLVLTGVRSPTIRFSAAVARDLSELDEARAQAISDELLGSLAIAREDLDPRKHFCLFFTDGLSLKEERISLLLADALEGIPLLGGSAGDDLAFKKTHVIFGGEALSGAAVLVLGESLVPFEVIKHQHFAATPRTLVITRADVATRRVLEIDGYPAVEGYARALGMEVADVTADVTFANPLTFAYKNELYVRSIQKVEADGAMSFYCAMEEGLVLSIGARGDMEAALAHDLGAARAREREKKADLFIGCNCILRALEAQKHGNFAGLGRTLTAYGEHVIGFDTYGEQLGGLHINQTLVGIALRDAEATAA